MDTSTKILIGTIILSIAVYLVYNISKKSTKLEIPSEQIEEPEQLRVEEALTDNSSTSTDNNTENTTLTNKEKGDLYEDFVIERLGQIQGNTFKNRNSDYHSAKVSAEANTEPDLKFRFGNIDYAVECKYRSANGTIEWAKSYQIKNYLKYQVSTNQKVLVALGLGGKSENPKSFYIIPLDEMANPFSTFDERKKYYIANDSSFIKLKELLK